MQKNSSLSNMRYYPVKMSMEVSFTYHSHIIGRKGQSINLVMKETNTKIHLPDENRWTGEKKSNEVTISGDLLGVETARQRIRSIIPVEYFIDCRSDMLDYYGRLSIIHDFALMHGVVVRMNEKSLFGASHCSVSLRSSQQQLPRLKDAVQHLLKICNSTDALVSMKMEISSETLKAIESSFPILEKKYLTSFHSFHLTHEGEYHKVIWIRGCVDAVYNAKVALMELLPLKVMFHVHASHLHFSVNERKLAKRLDVAVKMEASSKPHSFLLHISSYEKNAGNIYEFRRQILRLPNPNGLAPLSTLLAFPKIQEPQPTLLSTAQTLTSQPRFREMVGNIPISHSALPSIEKLSKHFESTLAIHSTSSTTMIPASLCALKFDPQSYRQLCQLMDELRLSQYNELFLVNEVDLAMFTTLGEEDLKAVGVGHYPARKLMMSAIEEIKGKPLISNFGESLGFPLYQHFH